MEWPGGSEAARKGDSFLIPAALGEVKLAPELSCRVLVARVQVRAPV